MPLTSVAADVWIALSRQSRSLRGKEVHRQVIPLTCLGKSIVEQQPCEVRVPRVAARASTLHWIGRKEQAIHAMHCPRRPRYQ